MGEDTVLQPDLLVARRSDFTDRDLPTAPLLAVEILSPNTRIIDTQFKRARYEAAGCPSYWVIDPDAATLTAWELRRDAYVRVAETSSDETFRTQAPYSVSVTPARLVD